MFNRDVRRRKGFSLIELLVAITIMLILVGVAAFFLEDYTYKAKVAKAQQDLDMFANAINYYEALEAKNFVGYNYLNALNTDSNFTTWYNALVASYDAGATWAAAGGAGVPWHDFSTNALHSLVGSYLKTVPTDPWGSKYYLNTAAGYVASLSADGKMSFGGNNSQGITEVGRGRDIVKYYLGQYLILTGVNVRDDNGDGVLTAGDFIEFTFNKDVQHGVQLTSFESSADDGATWIALGTDGSAVPAADLTKFYMSGNSTAGGTSGAIRVLDNGRKVRFVIDGMTGTGTFVGTNSIPVAQLVGKLYRINSTAVNDTYYSKTVMDMDPYVYNPSSIGTGHTPAGYSAAVGPIGRPARIDMNPAKQAKLLY